MPNVFGRADVRGLHTAMVGPTTLVGLLPAFDPLAAFVLAPQVGVLRGGGWRELEVPAEFSRGSGSVRLRARAIWADVLMETSAFLQLAPAWDGGGARVLQFRREPRSDVGYEDERVHARVARWRAAGLTVAVNLPHAHEVAQLAAVDPAELEAALDRLGAG